MNGLVSIEDMEKAIKIAKKEGSSHIGMEDGRMYSGLSEGFGFIKHTIDHLI